MRISFCVWAVVVGLSASFAQGGQPVRPRVMTANDGAGRYALLNRTPGLFPTIEIINEGSK